MTKIMIVKVPRGEAPEEIKKAWVGMVLPCIGKFPPYGALGALSGKPAESYGLNFLVHQDDALKVLHQKQPAAAKWWYAHGFPKDGRCFAFCEDEAVVLPGDEGLDAWG